MSFSHKRHSYILLDWKSFSESFHSYCYDNSVYFIEQIKPPFQSLTVQVIQLESIMILPQIWVWNSLKISINIATKII